MKIPQEIIAIVKKLEEAGFKAYLVGGCVRDLVLSEVEGLPIKPKDWDITTDAKPEEIQKIFSRGEAETLTENVGAAYKTVYENKFGTISLITDSEDETLKTVEITPFRLEGKYTDKRHPDEIKFARTVEEDLGRRDFTINALALKLETYNMKPETKNKGFKLQTSSFKIIDPFAGEKDLKNKIIRTVGEPEERFNEDALRLMRASRLAVELGFEIEEKTGKAVQKLASTLEFISKERIRDEFAKLLMTERAASGIEILENLGLLKYVLPELREGINVIGVTKKKKEHIKYEELTVFEHHLKTLDYAAKKNFNLVLRLAALLHDLGKPRTKKGEGLEATFKGHEQVGTKLTIQALERLHFSKKIIEQTANLVRWHFFFYNVDEVTEAGVRRLIRRVGPENIDDLLLLREADRSGSGLPKISPYRLKHLRYMIERVSRDPIHPKMLKVKGNDVMEILKILAGPKVGWILNILLEEVLDNPEKNDKNYLIEQVKKLGRLSDEELKELAEKSVEKKEELEGEIDEEMRKKHGVY